MNRLLLQITYRCTSRCRHCIYCSNDKVGGALTAGDVERIIHQTRPRECVVFTGGEASLLPDVVISGIKVATSLGIESWLNSNGSWGKDPGFAKEYSEALVTHGLSRANISVDALHQEFIPVDSVLNAIRALHAAASVDCRLPGKRCERSARRSFSRGVPCQGVLYRQVPCVLGLS
ncbi:MAG: radical SAM protein [bacterium]